MFLILPNSKLLIKFDTNEFNQINFDLNDKKIFTKLRVARKKIFDEFFMKEFSESTELPYNSILSLETIKILPKIDNEKDIESYDLNNPNKIVQILNNSFNILPSNMTKK